MDQFEKFMSTFFSQVAQLYFDKARELLERERELTRSGQLRQLMNQLLNFIEAERTYFNLGFLSVKNKIFLRKDNSLRSMYESLKSELHRLEDPNSSEKNLNLVINQLAQFLSVRTQFVELYERLYMTGTSNKPPPYEELHKQVAAMLEMHTYSFLHPILAPIRAIIMWECEVVEGLLGAQTQLAVCNMVASLLHLHSAHTRLTSWEKSIHGKESWRLGLGSGLLKGTQSPGLIQWLVKLKSAIVSKFSLYFYQTLLFQSSHSDMRALLANRHVTDYHHKLQSLVRKSVASMGLVVFETGRLENWEGPGFRHPDRLPSSNPSPPYIILVATPKMVELSPGLCEALNERSPDYILADKIICHFSVKDKCTYYMASLEPRVCLVVMFDSKRDERETAVLSHISEFSSNVRCAKVFAALKLSK